MNAKTKRLAKLRDLLEGNRLQSQDQIIRALAQDGIAATQATLSRDLRELGVLKGPEGYMLPGKITVSTESVGRELERALRAYLVSSRQAANIVVLKTGPGQAPALALEVDRAAPTGVVGSVAGDDTIFVATQSTNRAGRLVKLFNQMAQGSASSRD